MLNLLSDSWDRAEADRRLRPVRGRCVLHLCGSRPSFRPPSVDSSGRDSTKMMTASTAWTPSSSFCRRAFEGRHCYGSLCRRRDQRRRRSTRQGGQQARASDFGTDPYVGRIYSSPAFDLLETSGGGLLDLYRLTQGQEVNARKITREMLDLTSVVTGLPFGALKRPLGYVAGEGWSVRGTCEPLRGGERPRLRRARRNKRASMLAPCRWKLLVNYWEFSNGGFL